MIIGIVFIIGWLVVMTAIGFIITTVKESKDNHQIRKDDS